jgi:alpha-1,6-mannosyltransferase
VQKYIGQTAGDALMEAAERYVRHLYNKFARTFVPSAGLQQLLVDWGVCNTALAELGVNTTIFKPGAREPGFRERHKIQADAKLLLYVGRLAPEKNVKTLFEAFRILSRDSVDSYHLLVVGDGTTRDSLQRLPEKSRTWLPYCGDSAELAKLYREADLFVHPGVLETFGLVTLESQACGTPVVGIRGSYMDRIIFSNQRHWAAENSPESLAEAIRRTCAEDLVAIGAAASVQVRARYDWNAVFEKLLSVYESSIAQPCESH